MAEPLVVADTGPLISLSHIDAMHVLPSLYAEVLIPEVVADELKASRFESVHEILANNPWLHVRATVKDSDLALRAALDAGEAAARSFRVARILEARLLEARFDLVPPITLEDFIRTMSRDRARPA